MSKFIAMAYISKKKKSIQILTVNGGVYILCLTVIFLTHFINKYH